MDGLLVAASFHGMDHDAVACGDGFLTVPDYMDGGSGGTSVGAGGVGSTTTTSNRSSSRAGGADDDDATAIFCLSPHKILDLSQKTSENTQI
jgi:hypothetical protein